MLLLLLIYVVLRALWKIDVYLISTRVNKSLYYYHYYYYYYRSTVLWWLSVRGLAIIHSQTEGCACAEVDVHSGRLWGVLFAIGPQRKHLHLPPRILP